MGSRLFVGNVSFDTSEADLRKHFEDNNLNVVSARIVLDRETGRSRGFAFVELKDDAQAARAIEELDQKQCGNRPLSVREARERGGAPGGYGGGGGGGGGRPRESRDRYNSGGPQVQRRHGGGGPPSRDDRPPRNDRHGNDRPPRSDFPPRPSRDMSPPLPIEPEEDRHARRKLKHDRDRWERDDDDDWN